MTPNFELVITISLYATIVLAVMIVAFAAIASVAIYKGEAKTFGAFVLSLNPLQMIAVILIIFAATSLRFLDLISTDAIVSILSGIAGYVLGGTRWRSQDSGQNPKAT